MAACYTAFAALKSNRDFNIFWAGQTLSGLGDAFAFIALPLLVLQATGSLVHMGLVTGTFGVASLVAGVVSGAIVDRVDRRRLMILCDVIRAFAYSAIPITWLLFGPRVAVLYVVTAIGAMFGNAFQVASITAVANLVDKQDLTEANGRLQGSYGLMFLVGPTVAGTISQRFGPALAIGVDALSFVVSAISLRFVALPRARAERKMERPVDNLLAGVRFLWAESTLRWVTILLAAFGFIAAAFLDLYIFHLKKNLHQDDQAVGWVSGVAALGTIVGALLASPLRKRFGFGTTWIAAGIVQGAFVAAMGFAGTPLVIALLSCVFGVTMMVRNVSTMSLRQEITPDHLLGRVTSAFWTLITAPAPIGAAVATAVAERVGVSKVFVGMGVLILVLSIVGAFSPVRRR